VIRTPSKVDRRLLGTWQSDRGRTFRFYKPGPRSTVKGQRKLKSLFGKLIVRWTPRRCHLELDGTRWAEPYEVIASDETSVIIRSEAALTQIHFEGNYYWIGLHGMLCEYFRRID
jgi:hypothetical protein